MHIDRIQVDVVELYEVTFLSLDDGHRLTQGIYSNRTSAERARRNLNDGQIIAKNAIYIEDTEKYYLLDNPITEVWHISREEAIEQIPENAKKVLGL